MTLQQYLSLSSAAIRRSPNSIPVHSTILSSHLFVCLPFLLPLFIVPCRIVFVMPEDFEMWSYCLSFRFFSMFRLRSSCTPIAFWFCCNLLDHGRCRKCLEASYSISSQGLGSFFRVLLSIASSHRHKGGWIRRASAFSYLRSKRDVLVPPYDLQFRKSCCCLGNHGKNIGFWSCIRDDCPKVLEVFHCF